MSASYVAAQEAISEARAHVWAAVKLGAGRRALEGDIESAYSRLESARGWLRERDVEEAQREVAEAVELLRSDESHLIAQDQAALDAAIRVLVMMRWE